MKIFLLFYMFHFAMGLTHCYKTAVSLQYIYLIIQQKDFYNGLQSFNEWRLPTTQHCRLWLQSSNDIDRMNTYTALLLSPQISFSSVNLSHLATHLSASYSFTMMTLYKSIYLLKSAPKCIIFLQKPQKILWGGGTAPSQTPPPLGRWHQSSRQTLPPSAQTQQLRFLGPAPPKL